MDASTVRQEGKHNS
ncbi:hypothetical protein CGLO_07745 [Colletotrichum gloeosporioides Cg-14]|uniref:Uncharacterized protein n=1 Tax=Colletotrichum gloeosporioides (strain Cg-14) TaxID=1237896 RepID=T0KBA0_COLGC|nr:hypothetical protein CGLO_07745 [Colletotrichum gloeosporioides Cg-14]